MDDHAKVLDYINRLKSGSFEGWSEDEKYAYLTACISIEEFIKTISNPK